MGVSEKIMEALRAGILLNDRVSTLISTVERMDQDVRSIDSRVVRLETLVEVAKQHSAQGQLPSDSEK